jgi:hypothetical protein
MGAHAPVVALRSRACACRHQCGEGDECSDGNAHRVRSSIRRVDAIIASSG